MADRNIAKPVVMITGAAGSFGKELARRFRENGYQILRLLERFLSMRNQKMFGMY